MRRFLSIVSLALLLLGLASCTPSVTGTTPSTAIDTGFIGTRPAEITPGATWYLNQPGLRPDLYGVTRSVSDKRFGDSLRYNPRVGQTVTASATTLFKISEVDAPTGWQIRLHSATLQRKVTDVGSSTFGIEETISFVFAATVPENAALGNYSATIRLRGPDGDDMPLFLNFNVGEAPASH